MFNGGTACFIGPCAAVIHRLESVILFGVFELPLARNAQNARKKCGGGGGKIARKQLDFLLEAIYFS
jgi:hypothetical protein